MGRKRKTEFKPAVLHFKFILYHTLLMVEGLSKYIEEKFWQFLEISDAD